jgi:hypothetical protein
MSKSLTKSKGCQLFSNRKHHELKTLLLLTFMGDATTFPLLEYQD